MCHKLETTYLTNWQKVEVNFNLKNGETTMISNANSVTKMEYILIV
jgi:hypothetical protein